MSEAWDSAGGVGVGVGIAGTSGPTDGQVQFPVQFVVSNHPFDGSIQQRNGKGRWNVETPSSLPPTPPTHPISPS